MEQLQQLNRTWLRTWLPCAPPAIGVYVAGDRFTVRAGNVLAFPEDQAHSYPRHGDVDATAVSIVSFAPHKRKRQSL